jgi:hypothetical protein
VLAAELFADCPNPADTAAATKIAIANSEVSSLSDVDFDTTMTMKGPFAKYAALKQGRESTARLRQAFPNASTKHAFDLPKTV